VLGVPIIMGRFDDFIEAHARLKARIHAYRYPINSRAGRFGMSMIYFSTPIIIGYFIMQATNVITDRNLGKNREHLIAATEARKVRTLRSNTTAAADPSPTEPNTPSQ
jgi:hypothetical protein